MKEEKKDEMIFTDKVIESVDCKNLNKIYRMIVENLCGEKYYKELNDGEEALLSTLIEKLKSEGLNFAQFNELLLMLDQDRVSEAFFKFIFDEDKIKMEQLKRGIIKFRGFAMLCFGNFRFAYKLLVDKDKEGLEKKLKPYCRTSTDVDMEFKRRPRKAVEIEEIEKDKTWYTGYLSKNQSDLEIEILSDLFKGKKTGSITISKKDMKYLARMYSQVKEDIKKVEKKALRNTDVYLTWDYMDIYVATSMRNKWEFEETYEFQNALFNYDSIKRLKIRHFDPTQSQCKNRIDKGLVEGLMLKRALCTIYMAQESDTMGKDSELAATLAQGKPVIAYVPRIDIEKHTEKIKDYPLDFFKTRFYVLRAERIFQDEDCGKELKKCDLNFAETISKFIEEYDVYRSLQPFTLWEERENRFKQESRYFDKICRLLAIAEHDSFEKRALLLKERHPLALQVHLDSGVANGVLVVRNVRECAELLERILSNSMQFEIKNSDGDDGVVLLEEKISGCPYRVVTDYEKLTNSFWNFYLISD